MAVFLPSISGCSCALFFFYLTLGFLPLLNGATAASGICIKGEFFRGLFYIFSPVARRVEPVHRSAVLVCGGTRYCVPGT